MIEALDHEPLLLAVMGACRDIILQTFPCLRDGLICELLKPRDHVLEGIGFAQWKKTSQEMHWSTSPRLTLPPYWNRTIVSPFLAKKLERGKDVPHLESLLR
jgi:hypothetical protein